MLNAIKKNILNYRSNPSWKKKDQWILVGVGIVLQIVTIYYSQVRYEADAAGYYEVGLEYFEKGWSSFSNYRPHAFSLLLLFSGTYISQNFIGIIFFHSLMGVLVPVLVYRMLIPCSRFVALFGAGTLCLSFMPYTAATLILAEQLFMTAVVATYYFFSRYYHTNLSRYAYWSVAMGLLAMFTRWEGQMILVSVLMGIGWMVFRSNPKYEIHKNKRWVSFGISLGIAVFVIGTCSFLRAFTVGDLSQFGKLQGGSAFQFIWRFTGNISMSKPNWDNIFKSWRFSFYTPDPQVKNLLSPFHGPVSNEIYNRILLAIKESPPEKNGAEQPYNEKETHLSREQIYYNCYGKFSESPEKLAQILFDPQTQNDHYPFYIAHLVNKIYGDKADSKVFQWMLENFRAHPWIYAQLINDCLGFLGLGFLNENSLFYLLGPDVGLYQWFRLEFNMGRYAEVTLPPKHFQWLKNAYTRVELMGSSGETFHEITSTFRNWTRAILGPFVIFSFWSLFFVRGGSFFVFMILGLVADVMVVGSLGGGLNTRYEYATLPLIIVLASGCGFAFLQLVKKFVIRIKTLD